MLPAPPVVVTHGQAVLPAPGRQEEHNFLSVHMEATWKASGLRYSPKVPYLSRVTRRTPWDFLSTEKGSDTHHACRWDGLQQLSPTLTGSYKSKSVWTCWEVAVQVHRPGSISNTGHSSPIPISAQVTES